ncbi:MAG: hypothetical protein Q8S73_28915 [Deltaproteobacteria bacterium]|nr:hypothetical protein [Myxococcales bacterium]MDP3218162.1 hypothetical protein [Deltaproteobacteria bacterium]
MPGLVGGLLLLYALCFASPLFAIEPLGLRAIWVVLGIWLRLSGVLTAACGGLLVRALVSALRSLGETPPAWAPKALGALVGWWVVLALTVWPWLGFAFTPALSRALWDFALLVLAPAWGLAYAGGVAFALALASVMGRTARALARRERA